MIYNVRTFDYTQLEHVLLLKRGHGNYKDKTKYLDLVCAFDIETTTITRIEQSIMYIWQFQIEDQTVIGRTWNEFRIHLDNMRKYIPEGCRIQIYVHNLSFEYQFLKGVLHFDNVFAMGRRKILKAVSGPFEFRCSMIHSNMSLKNYLKKMGVRDQKVEGFDYKKKRYPWTRLSESELLYCVNDVRGLVEAVRTEMKRDDDNLYTFPLTSTGYIRREAKKVLGPYQGYIHNILPDQDVFLALRQCFRGGNTHANRYWSGQIVENVQSYDISSSYPSVMLTERFPGKFIKRDPNALENALDHGKSCIIHIHMEDVRLKRESFGCPYLAKAKCENILNGEYDNGRILSADVLECYITEVDLQIIMMEYDFLYKVLELWTARNKMLPKPFRDMIMKQYELKTGLKGVDSYAYGKQKNLINSAYGLMVQNPCKPEYKLLPDGDIDEDFETPISELIERYQRTGWLPYQWGVWITAYARLKLEMAIQALPDQDFIYCDTDSVKFIGRHKNVFDNLNKMFKHKELFADDKEGNRHYIGIYEKEDTMARFKTLGAKKYVYENEKGKLFVTISGVSKSKGPSELGSIENFKEGFVFREAGGTESIFNDHPDITSFRIQGHDVPITSNVVILDSTYTVNTTIEYRMLINFLANTDIRYSLHYER